MKVTFILFFSLIAGNAFSQTVTEKYSCMNQLEVDVKIQLMPDGTRLVTGYSKTLGDFESVKPNPNCHDNSECENKDVYLVNKNGKSTFWYTLSATFENGSPLAALEGDLGMGKTDDFASCGRYQVIQDDLSIQQERERERVALVFQEQQAQAAHLGDIAKNPDGSILHMSQIDAEAYCKEKGTRLPTARELAIYAKLLGAEGISNNSDNWTVDDLGQVIVNGSYNWNYKLVEGSDSAGNPDHFYYSHRGYKGPKGYVLWSSSIWVSRFNKEIAVYLGYSRGLDSGLRNEDYDDYAVRCIR